jgi:hypothetical protein
MAYTVRQGYFDCRPVFAGARNGIKTHDRQDTGAATGGFG